MLDRIRATLASLAPAEQKVAHLVLSDPRGFAGLPIADLAHRAGVSKPTVIRFCRSLGYGGLTDFKLRLAGSGEGVDFIHRSVEAGDAMPELLAKITDNTVAALLKFRNDASCANLDEAARLLVATIMQGGRVEIYGVGNSGIVAQDAQHKFFRLGAHAVAHSDGHLQVMSASILGARDCAIIVSNSGRTRDLIDAEQIARRNGAHTMAITASGTPLAMAAGLHLAADHPESYELYSPMVSRLLHLLIIDILATAVALRLGSATLQPQLRQMKGNLRSKRYA